MEVTFYGVRGSVPCSCERTRSIGGNTSCVAVRVAGETPIVLDCGTGLRYLGEAIMSEAHDEPFCGTALVSHLHWDHVQGLPFFKPILQNGAELTLVGPPPASGSLAEEIHAFLRPPLFPVGLGDLPGAVDIVESFDESFAVGSATVRSAPVPHHGPTNGYRIDHEGCSVAYVPDHQQPLSGSRAVAPDVLELCRGVDVLIHDAQYDEREFETKADWGHSTVDYAVDVALEVGASTLVLFHHDPAHDDRWVTAAAADARQRAGDHLEVLVAFEGLVVTIDRSTDRSVSSVVDATLAVNRLGN